MGKPTKSFLFLFNDTGTEEIKFITFIGRGYSAWRTREVYIVVIKMYI